MVACVNMIIIGIGIGIYYYNALWDVEDSVNIVK